MNLNTGFLIDSQSFPTERVESLLSNRKKGLRDGLPMPLTPIASVQWGNEITAVGGAQRACFVLLLYFWGCYGYMVCVYLLVLGA